MAGGWSNRIGRLTENFISSNSRFALPGPNRSPDESTENESTKFAVVAFGSQPGSPHRGRLIKRGQSIQANPLRCGRANHVRGYADFGRWSFSRVQHGRLVHAARRIYVDWPSGVAGLIRRQGRAKAGA